jgi:hypothetical protein
MRTLVLSLALVLSSLVLAQESRRVPQGIREADKADEKFEKSVEPPQNTLRRPVQHVQQDAAELAQLAQAVHEEIGQVRRGLLPADLKEKLKKIEKLSKQLRNELTP